MNTKKEEEIKDRRKILKKGTIGRIDNEEDGDNYKAGDENITDWNDNIMQKRLIRTKL